MKRIKTAKCISGEIIAEDIYNNNGIILVSKDTIINNYIKYKLIDLGVYQIKVYDEDENSAQYTEFKRQYKECLLLVKELLSDISSGNYHKIDKVANYITDLIYQNITDCDYMIKCLQKIRSKDEYTYTHCINTAFYSMLIGYWNNMPKDKLIELVCAALLHDIGKTKIPLEILNKKGRLDADEFEIMKSHASEGYEIVKNIPDFSFDMKKAILLHHERMDGSGYPFGLKGDLINLYARIISIADVYDAMTQDRIYKEKVSPFETFEMFLTEGIRQFDYHLLYNFMKHIAPFYIGTNVELTNGEIGEIVYIPPQDIVYPILSVNSVYVDLSKETDIRVLKVV